MSKKSLADLQRQMVALQREIDAMQSKERSEVVARIREAISHYDLKQADLFGAIKRGRKPRAQGVKAATTPSKRASNLTGKKVAVKYRDGDGNTWTGRGNRPRWLAAALAAGRKIDEFAI